VAVGGVRRAGRRNGGFSIAPFAARGLACLDMCSCGLFDLYQHRLVPRRYISDAFPLGWSPWLECWRASEIPWLLQGRHPSQVLPVDL